MRFYTREGFSVRENTIDPETGEQVYTMVWERAE